MANPERGISPEILLQHVENTAPWLFRDRAPLTPYTSVVMEAKERGVKATLSHFDYFSLCLAAHYSTVATFVPTDVDNQIRKHLWAAPLDVTERMAEHVLASLSWDFRPLTARYQEYGGDYVCGHQGEWFSVAVGAYARHRLDKPGLAKQVGERIQEELRTEARLFAGLKRARDGVGLLRAATAIAHNLGDLDRVIDQWELPLDDWLRTNVYKLGHSPRSGFAELFEAGELNKAFMASENHRHYPLRKPRCLRQSVEFLLPLGPFFDAWGEKIGRSPLIETRDALEVADALLEGFVKLSSPKIPLYGYARALGGLMRGRRGLADELPSKSRKLLEKGLIVDILREDERSFAASWSKRALQFMKL